MVIATGDGGVVKPYDAAPDNASQATPETWCATSPSLECLLESSLPAVSLLAMLWLYALSRLCLRIGVASSSCFRRSSDARTHATKRRHHLIKAVLPIDDVNSQLLVIIIFK